MVFCISLIENILRIIPTCLLIEFINFFSINQWFKLFKKFYLELIKRNLRNFIVSTNEVISLIWRSKVVISLLCSPRIDPFRWGSGYLTLSLLGFSTNILKPAMWKRSSTQSELKNSISKEWGCERLAEQSVSTEELSPVGWFKLSKGNLKATPRHKLCYSNWVCQLSIVALLNKAISKNVLLQ